MGRKRQPHPRKAEQAKPSSGFEFSRHWVIGLILGFTFLGFANSIFNNQFAYDDQTQILGNELIRDFTNLPTAFTKEVWFFRYLQDQDPNKQAGPTTPYYRPMFTVYLMVGWQPVRSVAAALAPAQRVDAPGRGLFCFLILEK